MSKEKQRIDENDIQTFEDFEEFYGFNEQEMDEPKELDFDKIRRNSIKDDLLEEEIENNDL